MGGQGVGGWGVEGEWVDEGWGVFKGKVSGGWNMKERGCIGNSGLQAADWSGRIVLGHTRNLSSGKGSTAAFGVGTLHKEVREAGARELRTRKGN